MTWGYVFEFWTTYFLLIRPCTGSIICVFTERLVSSSTGNISLSFYCIPFSVWAFLSLQAVAVDDTCVFQFDHWKWSLCFLFLSTGNGIWSLEMEMEIGTGPVNWIWALAGFFCTGTETENSNLCFFLHLFCTVFIFCTVLNWNWTSNETENSHLCFFALFLHLFDHWKWNLDVFTFFLELELVSSYGK